MYNAAAEIGTGFLLTVMLATQRRAIVLTILHWNWLRMRYFSPDAAAYHSMVGMVLCPNRSVMVQCFVVPCMQKIRDALLMCQRRILRQLNLQSVLMSFLHPTPSLCVSDILTGSADQDILKNVYLRSNATKNLPHVLRHIFISTH